jgi:sulfite reductase (ferredoxin)
MACPALPLCGLATTEAERALPDINVRIRAAMVKVSHAHVACCVVGSY